MFLNEQPISYIKDSSPPTKHTSIYWPLCLDFVSKIMVAQ